MGQNRLWGRRQQLWHVAAAALQRTRSIKQACELNSWPQLHLHVEVVEREGQQAQQRRQLHHGS